MRGDKREGNDRRGEERKGKARRQDLRSGLHKSVALALGIMWLIPHVLHCPLASHY